MQNNSATLTTGSTWATRDGQRFTAIDRIHEFRPFLINVVSASNLWMFLSSRGGLTAGRGSAQGAIFPYETVDRLHHAHHTTGPLCLLRVQGGESDTLWNPFGDAHQSGTECTIFKNLAGNQVIFESRRDTFPLTVTQRWTSAERLGHVRTVTITNESSQQVSFDFIDGVRNLLPWGVDLGAQRFASCLVDAYKRCEIDVETGIGVFCLTSKITDRTDPAESLRANTVWQTGLTQPTITLSDQSVDMFAAGSMPAAEPLLTGQRGNYFVSQQNVKLAANESLTWHIVLDTGLDHVQLVGLRQALIAGNVTADSIEQAVENGRRDLLRLIGTADGLQTSANAKATVHHFANTTFNCMRGGLFVNHHQVPTAAFRGFVQRRNTGTFAAHQSFLEVLQENLSAVELLAATRQQRDPNLVRHCYEFLPLTFSRRHGDPSRPWNTFAIRVRNQDGKEIIHYEGNWRDIFQNWEATCMSFPQFFPSVVARFVNGSTADGFNPYRVTSEGLEWETPDPEDPWSQIGYWGDHQVVYLLKLMESLQMHHPAKLQEMLTEDSFVYLQVPYRLKPYGQLVRNRRNTIDFDEALDKEIQRRVVELGEDGKLLRDKNGQVYAVNLMEKLLVPALNKVSNFVAGGGIWMNTQRPEWNDANNALVGNGISVVTLAHLHQYSTFLLSLCEQMTATHLLISREVVKWMQQVMGVLEQNLDILSSPLEDAQRRKILDDLGEAFSDYRTIVYDHGFSKRLEIERGEIERFFELVRRFTEHTLLENERPDGLFHSYNLLDFGDNGWLHVRHLHEMLEGQVAAITSGVLSCRRVIALVEALYDSRMYRADQHSFMLYPAAELADFMDRNVIPQQLVDENPLLTALVQTGNRDIITQDALAVYRFHGDMSVAADVQCALNRLAEDDDWTQAVHDHRAGVLDVFSRVFQHHAYTGRSGTMYGYEGIGCVYWHMVSKLLLAVQTTFHRAIQNQEDEETIGRLGQLYLRVRRGLCFEKSAAEYGAFPTDPYSHTPAHSGAQQPGMTGQVKEGIRARWGELGVRIEQGRIRLAPRLLSIAEFVSEPTTFTYVDFDGQFSELELQPDELGFTYCQVPIVYRQTDDAAIAVEWRNGRVEDTKGDLLPSAASADLLGRLGQVNVIRVNVDQRCWVSLTGHFRFLS